MTDNINNLASAFKIPCPTEIGKEQLVIVAEDQQDMRLIVAHQLQKMGLKNVIQCQNGYEVINAIKNARKGVAVVISDTDMPELGGLDLLNELSENPEMERPPFCLMLDNPSKERIMLALERGVDEIMVRPFTLNDIFPKAISAFRTFHNAKNPEKVYELAKSFYREDKIDEAEKVYTAIAKATTKTARPWVGLARIAIKRKQFDQALKLLDEAEKRNPNFVHTFSTRAEIYSQMGQLEESIQNYRHAINLSPLNPLRYDEAAKPLFALKRYQEGVDLLNIAVTHELNFPSLHNYLSEGYYALKDYKKATKHIKVALRAKPDDVTYLNQLGICLKESKEYEEAMKIYNSIIKLDNDNKAAYFNKAVLYQVMGNIPEAIKTLQRVVKRFPDFTPGTLKLQELEKLVPPASAPKAS